MKFRCVILLLCDDWAHGRVWDVIFGCMLVLQYNGMIGLWYDGWVYDKVV